MSWGVMGWGVIEEGWRKGPWTAEEDRLLIDYVRLHGEGRWNSVARLAGLKRNGKSCRLRWVNYLRPDLKRGQITPHEENIILELHARWGNRWSTIARSLPGRTDNEIKNYWRTHFKKKTKGSPDNSSKVNKRMLKRQQFHHHQQQLQHQQQHCLQDNQVEMKKMVPLLDENEQKVPYFPQMTTSFYSHTTPVDQQEQGFNYLNPTTVVNGSVCEVNNDDLLWDGLWNLDDVHVNFGGAPKPTFHNLVTPFC